MPEYSRRSHTRLAFVKHSNGVDGDMVLGRYKTRLLHANCNRQPTCTKGCINIGNKILKDQTFHFPATYKFFHGESRRELPSLEYLQAQKYKQSIASTEW